MRSASLDLSAPWNEHDIVVIDTESTGPNPETARIVEIAAVRFRAGEVIDWFGALVNPGCPIPPDATAVHGITDEMVAECSPLEAHAHSLIRVALDAVPCAYNAPYDRTLLHRTITGNDCPAIDPTVDLWIDPLVIIRKVDRYARRSGRHKLANTCRRWNVDLEQQHRALGDATATGKLLFRLLDRGAVKPCSLGRFLDYLRQQREAQDAESATFRARNDAQRREMRRLDIARCWNAAGSLIAWASWREAVAKQDAFLERLHDVLGMSVADAALVDTLDVIETKLAEGKRS